MELSTIIFLVYKWVLPSLSDSLAAIKKLVFEEGRLTPQELWHALETDYEGERGKEIQEVLSMMHRSMETMMTMHDSLVREAYDVHVDEIAKYPNTRYGRGPIGIRYSGTSSISANVGQGRGTCFSDGVMRTPYQRMLSIPQYGPTWPNICSKICL